MHRWESSSFQEKLQTCNIAEHGRQRKQVSGRDKTVAPGSAQAQQKPASQSQSRELAGWAIRFRHCLRIQRSAAFLLIFIINSGSFIFKTCSHFVIEALVLHIGARLERRFPYSKLIQSSSKPKVLVLYLPLYSAKKGIFFSSRGFQV